MVDREVKKIQIFMPEGEARYRKVKVMCGEEQLPVHTFEMKPGGELGYELTLKIRTSDFEVVTTKEEI